ncbi:hypothetical protein FZC76_06345 [Sutcliffiella horikoshii]|uniref:Uncharacterized protein n=1 Tax=Sutcliffiella horikoshii TaxID=79883 RepID=A0A5D4T700_9BACI|nr:hypothetical protein [Sutcliffiella horikoshii]TYS69844.1 hypothetical protein FZC76_06345 [Sutcliffiella horikoshii]
MRDGEYWKCMYEELEVQMKEMMHMSLEMVEKYQTHGWEEKYSELQKKHDTLLNENRKLKLFEHRVKITFVGKLALKYIQLKAKLKNTIKK